MRKQESAGENGLKILRSPSRAAKLSSFEKHDRNPFVDRAITEVEITRRYRTHKGSSRKSIHQVVDSGTGDVVGHTIFVRQIEVDEEQFTKIYLSQFQVFWELPPSAIRVFGYIMTRLKPNSDMFSFQLQGCLDHTRYANKKAIYIGLAALVSAGIIARGFSDAIYYINPLIAFNGDRVSYVKTYIKQKQEEAHRAQDALPANQLKMEFA